MHSRLGTESSPSGCNLCWYVVYLGTFDCTLMFIDIDSQVRNLVSFLTMVHVHERTNTIDLRGVSHDGSIFFLSCVNSLR